MPVRCRLCDQEFADHVVVHARASVHWRGKSFDAEEAQGAIGLRVMRALGEDASDPAAMDAFLESVHVESFREDPMGVEPWKGDAERDEGEDWEFHLGFREALDPDELEAAGEAARDAVEDHGNFEAAKVGEGDAVEEAPASEPGEDADEGSGEAVDTWSHPDLDGG